MTQLAPAPAVAPPSRAIGVGFGVIAALMVGGSVPITGLLVDYPLFGGQAIRYGLSAVLVVVWARLARIPLPRPTGRDVPALLAVAVAGMVGFTWCIMQAQRYVDPGLVAAVIGGAPILLALIGPLLEGSRPAVKIVGASVVVTAGIALVAGIGGPVQLPGLLFAGGALVGETAFTLCALGLIRRIGPVALSAYSAMTATVLSLACGIAVDGAHLVRTPTADELVGFGVVIVLTTAAFLLWFDAVRRLGSDRAGLLVGLMPVSGLLVSVLIGAQALTLVAVAGTVLVAIGTATGLSRRSAVPETAPTT